MLIDTHFHLDLMDNMQMLIRDLSRNKDVGVFAIGTTPAAYKQEIVFCNGISNICVGLGFHPQLISERSEEISLFRRLLVESNVVGEIGLDFSSVYQSSRDLQIACFQEICRACSREGGKCLTIHSVKSAGTVISVLEEAGTFKACHCIFHWFTGSKSELKKAIENGAYFSINSKMLKTKSGQETIQTIPVDKILLETDAPFTYRIRDIPQLKNDLTSLIKGISALRGFEIGRQIEENSIRIFSLGLCV